MQAWIESDLGQYMLDRELAWFDAVSVDLFGFQALQLGGCNVDYLRANRMPYRLTAGLSEGTLYCHPEQMPIASQSLDLVALPHMLEFSLNPHLLLREVERVLRPEGRLLLAGFNPLSLWGLRRALSRRNEQWPWRGRFIHLYRIKDWLALLGFEIAGGRMCCYAPPIEHAGWIHRSNCLESAGDRWWALGGGVYLLHAVKRVTGLRLIAPKWDGKWRSSPAWSPSHRETMHHEQ